MVPWHPSIVHFPIALAAMAALFQLLAVITRKSHFTVSALVALAVGAGMAFVAAITGTAQEEAAKRVPGIEAALERHELFGTLGAAIMLALSFAAFYLHMKKILPPRLFLAALVALAVLLLATGFLGGELVYIHGAGRL
ncbi:MAG: DUF2231 domain-containing protein [Candidatus Marinimicrobia bacterium]|nr:DUF2231 domain-containing protein [Candidatus Neomarinimicrobiota bacterium]